MLLCGRKTRAMFHRYNITNREDLARAVAKRFGSTNGTHKARREGAQEATK